ncbi:hypothetical protein H6P81_013008 [Aristolochia fimbriata]|uniref:Exocyst component Exo84 C-terminal domain-containing protein n=1 Tax=Aristolochia fimbriata TaxID=158543 RepID=A0AAV7EDE9_ARIFI|nr:hypothetical protein H6P81_013008 [Aristolochia fimbriata]
MERTCRFRFTDEGIGDSTESGESRTGETSFDSCPGDDGLQLESMTGKGIKRLCSELIELKKASDDEFYRNVCAQYSAFLSIFDKVRSLECELAEMKQHLSSQRSLVHDFMSGDHIQLLSQISQQPALEKDLCSDPYHLSKLEIHTKAIIDTLDVLLIEHRFDEALLIFQMEETNISMILEEEVSTPDALVDYDSALSEMRRRLVKQLLLEAEDPRISPSEFQEILLRLCRLGEHYRANNLLVQYYHRRLARSIRDLQCSKQFLHEMNISEHAKLLFSMISQAAKSYVMLYYAKSPYPDELLQWAQEETKMFAHRFASYVDSLSETTGGLLLAAEAVQNVIRISSLLDSQRVLLTPCLTKLIQPCVEKVLRIHVGNLKKVIRVIASVDNWTLGKFFVLGLQRCKDSPNALEEKPEYYLLTNSGRKLVTIMQAIVEDSSQLVILQMDNLILKGLADLFIEYVEICKRSISISGNAEKKDRLPLNLATSLSQQLSVLTNLSTLAFQIFPSIAKSIFQGHGHSDDEQVSECTGCSQNMELQSRISTIKEAANHLRHHFCEQFVFKVLSPAEAGCPIKANSSANNVGQLVATQDPMPSDAFKELYLHVRLLERHAKDIFVGEDLVAEDLLRELMVTVFDWLKNDRDSCTAIVCSIPQLSANFSQFVLDIEFLLEVARVGGYLSEGIIESSEILISRMGTAFLRPGLDPNSLLSNGGWIENAAKEAIMKLQDTEIVEDMPQLIRSSMYGVHYCAEEVNISDADSCSSVVDAKILSWHDDSVGVGDWQITAGEIAVDVNYSLSSQEAEHEDSIDLKETEREIITQEVDRSSDQIDACGSDSLLESTNANDAETANLSSIENEEASSGPTCFTEKPDEHRKNKVVEQLQDKE